MTTIPRIRIASDEFQALACGEAGAAAVNTLRRGQLSKRLLKLRLILDHAAGDAADDGTTEAAFVLLERVQRHAPTVFVEAMLQTHLGAWQARRLAAIRGTAPRGPGIPGSPSAYLCLVAASAAVQAGLDFRISVPRTGGGTFFPLLGRAAAGATTDDGLRIVAERGRVRLLTPDGPVSLPADLSRDAPGWRAARRLEVTAAGRTLRVVVDDLDPYRRSSGLAVAAELTHEEVGHWSRTLSAAWEILAGDHPAVAAAMAAGLKLLIPLEGTTARRGVSATSADSFGAVFMSAPVDPVTMAEGLQHEFHHSELNGLLDLVPLVVPDHRPIYYAPWRDDPRPLPGLLHGVYAYLGVTSFWRRQRHRVTATESMFANYEFARWREQSAQAAKVLLTSGALTPEGQRFMTILAETLTGWASEKVPEAALAAARLAALDHRVTWRLNNLPPDPAETLRLAVAWHAGDPCPAGVEDAPPPRSGAFAPVDNPRLALLHRRLKGLPADAPGNDEPLTVADAALIAGRTDEAALSYVTQIRGDAESVPAWTGLALARMQRRPEGMDSYLVEDGLLRRPEMVRALYCTLRASGLDPDPEALGTWLWSDVVDLARIGAAQTGGVSMSKSAR